MAQEQLEAVHATGVGRSGLLLRRGQSMSKEPCTLEGTSVCPMLPWGCQAMMLLKTLESLSMTFTADSKDYLV